MALSEEVKQLILILEEEDFGALAGELLTEISLGREVEKAFVPDNPAGRSSDTEKIVSRVPIEQGDQLYVAMSFLQMRLVLPVRAFAEAERIANQLSNNGDVRIRFIDPSERIEAEPISRKDTGDASVAERLGALLDRLPSMRVGPDVDGA